MMFDLGSIVSEKCLCEVEMLVAGVISGALLYIKDEFEAVNQSSFLQVLNFWFLLTFLVERQKNQSFSYVITGTRHQI